MTADRCTDRVDLHLAVQMGKTGFHQRGDGFGVLHAGGFADVALAAVVQPALGKLLHLVHDLPNDPLLGADLFPGDQTALVVHVQQGTNAQNGADEARRLGHAAALDVEGQVGGEEPVVQMEAVSLGKITNLLNALALITQVGKLIHEKTIAGGSAERINYQNLIVGIFFRKLLSGDAGGVD